MSMSPDRLSEPPGIAHRTGMILSVGPANLFSASCPISSVTDEYPSATGA